jgi:hypothetical protein
MCSCIMTYSEEDGLHGWVLGAAHTYVPTASGYCTYLQAVVTVRTYSQWLLYVPTASGYCTYLQPVVTARTYSQWLLHVPTASGYCTYLQPVVTARTYSQV